MGVKDCVLRCVTGKYFHLQGWFHAGLGEMSPILFLIACIPNETSNTNSRLSLVKVNLVSRTNHIATCFYVLFLFVFVLFFVCLFLGYFCLFVFVVCFCCCCFLGVFFWLWLFFLFFLKRLRTNGIYNV